MELSRASHALLTRPDVALVPFAVIAIGSLALALSQALRPAGGEFSPYADEIIIPGALLFGLSAGVLGLVAQRTAFVQQLRGAAWAYAFATAVLLTGLTVVALLDRGLATVAFTGVLLVAPYIGLVFPPSLSRASLAALLLLMVAIQVVRPDADAIEVWSMVALVVAGWLVGLISRSGHALVSRLALVMSRSDALTKGLNRRGLLEQFAHDLRQAAEAGSPFALLVIDLNGFKLINDRQGHAAGDELLAWVGECVPRVIPESAAFGRLGGDEFAVVAPGLTEAAAEALGKAIHATLSERVGASIGIGTRADGAAELDALLATADSALYAAKADTTRRVHVREAPRAHGPVEPEAPRPYLSYARLLRARDKAAAGDTPTDGLMFDGRWIFAGFVTIGLSGLVFVVSTIAVGGDTFYEELIRYVGFPWVALNLGLGLAYRKVPFDISNPVGLPVYASAVLVGVGVGAAALSTGDGAASPILAGLYLKLLFDASLFGRRHAVQLAAVIVFCWALVVGLGPADARWVVPFQLVLIGGAFALGSIGRNAFESATMHRLRLAHLDPLTGLLNRRGFMRSADRAVAEATAEIGAASHASLAVIALDLDDFKHLNDRLGHAAGDRLLQGVADACTTTLHDAVAVGRLGGDEFVAIIEVDSAVRLEGRVAELDDRLGAVAPASVGSALFGPDGLTLDQLLRVADRRAYEAKAARATGAPAPAPRST